MTAGDAAAAAPARAAAVRRALAAAGDPAKAPAMQAYMKSDMPYRGVQTSARRRLVGEILQGMPFTGRADWEATIDELWDGAGYREERYAAVDLAGHRSAAAWQDPAAIPRYDHWAVTGAWWDHVDAVAIHRIGPVLRAYREPLTPIVRRWITDPDLWRRRTSILCQITAKGETDVGLLTDSIVPNMADPDFFIRKALGWALREHAKTDPAWVRAFVAEHRESLSPLSYREATKHL